MSQFNISDMNKDKPTLNATDTLNYSASLVEKSGKSTLPDGLMKNENIIDKLRQ